MSRRGPKFVAADCDVPERYKEWALEYRIGFNVGEKFKPYFQYHPAFRGPYAARREAAYRAGIKAGRCAARDVLTT